MVSKSTITSTAPQMSKGQKKATDFLDKLPRKKATLRDHLLKGGFNKSFPEFRSMMIQCKRLLAAGGSHHHLLGKVVFPSEPSGKGRPPEWGGSCKLMRDRAPEPSWRGSELMLSIGRQLAKTGVNDDDFERGMSMVAKMGIRAQNTIVNDMIMPLTERANREAALASAYKDSNSILQKELEDSRQKSADILHLIESKLDERLAPSAAQA